MFAELLERRAAVSPSELCHADGLYYVDISGCNLLVDNSGKYTVVMGTDAEKQAMGFAIVMATSSTTMHLYQGRLVLSCLAVLFICSRLS